MDLLTEIYILPLLVVSWIIWTCSW